MLPADICLLLLVSALGLCFGSFYNVVILRGLSGESIAFPGSKCPKCNTPLKWYHNIPVLSYLFLGGKCAFCKCKISVQYPVVELVTMLLFICSYLKWGVTVKTLFAAAFLSLFLITTVTDILEKVILTRHAYILGGLGFLYSILSMFYPQLSSSIYFSHPVVLSILGILTGVLVMEILADVGYLFAGTRAFGEGDTYIAGALGAIFGWKYILIILCAGFIIQFVFSLPMFLINTYKNGKKLTVFELILFLILAGVLGGAGNRTEAVIYISGLVLLALIALHLIRNILKDIKTPSGCTYLPYVPAMIAAAVAGMFLWF